VTRPALGFHASHEQLPPSGLLAAVVAAADAGFDAAMCSDHFAPWSERQGHSGFAWAWLGAAMQATSLPFGVVTAPGQRYHPAITAQAAATLAEMFPDRFWVALGSGENLNEHVTGDPWPTKPRRDARLAECAGVIRALLDGHEVTHSGSVHVDRARLWSRPVTPPPLFAAAVSARTAASVAEWADGLITVNQPLEAMRATVDAFRAVAGDKPVHIQVHVSWASTEEAALEIAHDQWRFGAISARLAWELAMPQDFDDVTARVRPDDVRDAVLVSADLDQHVAWIREMSTELEPAGIYLHHVGREQRAFLESFGAHVLPACRS
jgi:probable non-F420 flavinoid oxidoreductase